MKRIPPDWMEGLLVEDMTDGGMGSLSLLMRETDRCKEFGSELAECRFKDSDGVEVVATLYADANGLPFELDVWKVDFSPLQVIPAALQAEPCNGNETNDRRKS